MLLPDKWIYRVIVAVALAGMALPLLGTLLYSLADVWIDTFLPQSYTLKWYIELFLSDRFITSLMNSVFISVSALLVTVVLVVPTVFVIHYYFPSMKGVMNLLILTPFAVPPVVSSVGLMQLFSSEPLALTGTPWILIGAHFSVALPFMYRAIANNMGTMNLNDMVDAAHILGASTWRVFFQVIVPNVKKGLMVSIFLCFSLLFGEFVFASLLVGARFETVQVFLYNVRHYSGHFSSAIVIGYFALVLLMTSLAIRLGKEK